jgi:4-amino-4-deoxy-L-arabinose transferase-like glycosyltransferase
MVVRILAGLILVYAALLRFDALTLIHGPVLTPAWIGAIQETRPAVSAWRPGPMTWERWEGRYISDPYTYLQYAREPRGFYDAHRREPGFVFATRASLWVFGDQDLAVSWASALFSVLAVWGTFLLGRLAFSPAVGLIAAAGLAIEMTVITWAAGGWRDDAFMAAVVFTAHALLRMRASPTVANAVWLGVVTAAACLFRITALSFVVPAVILLWWLVPLAPRVRLQRIGVVLLTLGVLFGPYVINCWRVYGDPLYAINVHADIYREAQGQQVESSQTAREYLRDNWRQRPMTTVDTVIQGLTTYPFRNKWDGFVVWHPWLPQVLQALALIGLVIMLGATTGRVLLVLLVCSLVPYAITWKLIGDWRFTAHAYPFYLIAVGWVLVTVPGIRSVPRPSRRVALAWTGVAVVVGLVTWVSAAVLPLPAAGEILRFDRAVTMAAGFQDRSFFVSGWARPTTTGNVTARISVNETASLRLPAVPGEAYDVMLRMDPFPAPASDAALPVVRLYADGLPAGRVQTTWDPTRIGAYLVPMPPPVRSTVELQLMVEPVGTGPNRLRVWWVQVRRR